MTVSRPQRFKVNEKKTLVLSLQGLSSPTVRIKRRREQASDLSGAGVFCAKMVEKSGFLREFQRFFGINVDYVVNLLYNMHINIK